MKRIVLTVVYLSLFALVACPILGVSGDLGPRLDPNGVQVADDLGPRLDPNGLHLV